MRVNMLSSFDNYLQVVDSNGRLVTYNDDGTGLNAQLDFISIRLPDPCDVWRRWVHRPRAQAVTATVGNLYNGSTASGVLSSGDAANALRYGCRSDDYNLQNGWNGAVDMLSSFDNYLQVVDSNNRLVATMTAERA